jgi:hypothetical protein
LRPAGRLRPAVERQPHQSIKDLGGDGDGKNLQGVAPEILPHLALKRRQHAARQRQIYQHLGKTVAESLRQKAGALAEGPGGNEQKQRALQSQNCGGHGPAPFPPPGGLVLQK